MRALPPLHIEHKSVKAETFESRSTSCSCFSIPRVAPESVDYELYSCAALAVRSNCFLVGVVSLRRPWASLHWFCAGISIHAHAPHTIFSFLGIRQLHSNPNYTCLQWRTLVLHCGNMTPKIAFPRMSEPTGSRLLCGYSSNSSSWCRCPQWRNLNVFPCGNTTMHLNTSHLYQVDRPSNCFLLSCDSIRLGLYIV